MKEQGYTAANATAINTVSSVIGIIIPPSIPLILYGIVTETSISRLFIAGIIPGLLIGFALMVTTYILAKRMVAAYVSSAGIASGKPSKMPGLRWCYR